MKVLIICFGGPAELLCTTPVSRCLKKQLPGTDIHYLLLSQYKQVLESNPYIDRLHLIQDGRTGLSQLDELNFDHVVDLQCDDASTKIVAALKKPALRYKKTGLLQFLSKVGGNANIAQRYLSTVTPLGIKNDGAGLDYFVPQKGELNEKDIPASHHYGFVAITMSTDHSIHKIPTVKLQEICKAIEHPVMLLGDKNDFSKSEAIASIDPIKVYNACGKFSYPETADLIRKSKLLVAQNSDLMQLAAALKKPVIAIWSNSSQSRTKSPYYGAKSGLYDSIKIKNNNSISVEQIVHLINKRLVVKTGERQAH